jgi:Putative auto-transporter adhesin, head GIN domain
MRRAAVLSALLLSLGAVGCGLFGEEGSGVLVTRRLQVPAEIDSVRLADGFRATIATGRREPAGTVTIDDNLVGLLQIDVDGSTLSIDLSGQVRGATLRVDLGLIRLRALELSGASAASVRGPLTGDLTVEASGASEADLPPMDLDDLELSVSGASNVSAEAGGTGRLQADVSGSSHVALFEVQADEAELVVSGSSEVEVTVIELLDSQASGGSSVRFRGEPERVIRDESGGSSVEPA